jgi:hypothetical protein
MHFGSFVGIAAAPSLPELRLRSDTSKGNAFTPWQGRNNSITSLSEVQPKGRASERSGESESRLGKIIHLLVPDRPFSRRSSVEVKASARKTPSRVPWQGVSFFRRSNSMHQSRKGPVENRSCLIPGPAPHQATKIASSESGQVRLAQSIPRPHCPRD